MVLRDYFVLFKRLGFAFSLFLISRVLFYFYNLKYFSVANLGETIWAFFVGLRFDLATTLIANIFFIIFSLIPIRNPKYHLFLKFLFVIFNSIFLGLIIVDFEFFAFNGKKLTLDIFFIAGDIGGQFFQVIFYYWHLSLLTIATMGILWRYYPRRKKEYLFEMPMKIYKSIPLSLIIFILTAIGVRGGLQLRSISAKDAFIFETYELGNFAVNSAYTFARSLSQKGLEYEKFFKKREDVYSTLENLSQSTSSSADGLFSEKQNVIIIILESFSMEYIENGYAPFLKSLESKSLFFKEASSNGRRSIEALPSILAGFPSIIGKPLYQSNYQANKILGVPNYLKDYNYKSYFFHGGKTGTMNFDSFCRTIGFDRYFGKEDYPNDDHYDGHWGIYDHHYFDFMLNKLAQSEPPFFATFFSLSSHQPYSIPSEFLGQFPKGNLPIHESIGYTDYALKKFFEKAQKQSWYNNTLFIITADHTQKLETKKYQTVLGRYRVPLIFYHPKIKLESNKKVVQQVDILPSILDILDIKPEEKLLFGTSVFNDSPGKMLNFNSGNYIYRKAETMILYDKSKLKVYTIGEDGLKATLRPEQSENEYLKELKAYIQYTNNGLIRNNIYTP
tara:strand:+ start:536 stop:2386 length:1851 start_codon:yes stop_codon:yes gene_type:complete